MKNNTLPNDDFEDFDDLDGYSDLLNETGPEENYEEPENWTIITAMNRVLNQARRSELSEKFWETCKNPIDFLTKELGLSRMQVVIVALLVESEDPMSWRDMGNYLHCSRLSMMIYSEEIEDLMEKRWICKRESRGINGSRGFTLENGVVTAIRHNKCFVPEKIDGLGIQELMTKVESHLDKVLCNHHVDFEEEERWMVRLCKANPHLPLCHHVMKFQDDIHVQALLMMIVYDYAQWADSDDEGLALSVIDRFFPEEYETRGMRSRLKRGSHVLIQEGYIEHKCEDGVADVERYVLTRECKENILKGYVPSKSKCVTRRDVSQDLKKHAGIKTKRMFYNSTEQEQIDRLTTLLSQENLPGIQKRLEDEGMRKGFACLFFGAPGTGKTETVLQIARQTGRDIMQIDIAGMRDKYVGESEKNIKAVFARYKDVCKQSEVMPILFFNEADAIFGKRTTIGGLNSSVEKMDNTMQNIILQEMEDLEGILIATTNLTCNLDDAFERRFLFKVDFQKPDVDVKTKLWQSMLGDGISEQDARVLASRYDFSGGQIENIARKRTIEFILSGKKASLEEIDGFCQHELLNKKKERQPIGYRL